jgi:membrane peptidoglycan carboxypeptidase
MAHQVRSQLGLGKPKLKPGAQVPTLEVYNPKDGSRQVYDLVGDRYTLGRSTSQSQRDPGHIVVHNELISGIHLTLSRNARTRGNFQVNDGDGQRGSTNGLYWDRPFLQGLYRHKQRIRGMVLQDNDRLILAKPELADAVELRYRNPPPLLLTLLRYGIYGISGFVMLVAAIVLWEWQQFTVRPLGSVQGPIAAYAQDGQPLQTLTSATHRELPRLKDFSPYLPAAVLASEDSRFYWHFGVDPLRLAGAIFFTLANVQKEGGSTLTMQMARSLFPDYVGDQDSLGRKWREMMVSLKLEALYSKEELLTTYINRVYLGVGYGFEDAARRYYNKSAAQLTLAEAATLVGILPAPNAWSPCVDLKQAANARQRVIDRMLKLNFITPEEAEQASRTPTNTLAPNACETQGRVLSPYYFAQMEDEFRSQLGYPDKVIREGNFIIETSLNLKLQNAAEKALQNSILNDGAAVGFRQGAIVTLDASDGSILALVGGFDYQESQFNRATQAVRQPGSTFKVFVYTEALEQGISPYTQYSCSPFSWQGYSGGCEHGGGDSADFFQAVAKSENGVALRVAKAVGLEKIIALAKAMGIQSPLEPVPGLVLGEKEVTVLELTGAFGVLANGGKYYPPHAIKRIYDSRKCPDPAQRQTCQVLYDFNALKKTGKPVISAQTAQTMTQILQGVVSSGTGVNVGIPGAAGKTGTTNDAVDSWFVGYLPDRQWVTGIWLGNDDNTPTSGGSGMAAKLWGDYMRQVL